MTKSAGQAAYEKDVAHKPDYDDGSPRKKWHELPDYARSNWEKYSGPVGAK